MHWIQDPRSQVYNFTPFVQQIPDIKDFAFDRLTPFMPSSRDTVMRNLALNQGKRFAGSTSSLTGLLSHIYYLMAPKCEFATSTLCDPFGKMVIPLWVFFLFKREYNTEILKNNRKSYLRRVNYSPLRLFTSTKTVCT